MGEEVGTVDRPLVAIADPHLGTKGSADDSCPEGMLWALDAGMIYNPAAFVWLGDVIERMENAPEDVITAHKDLFLEFDLRLSLAKMPLWFFKGNHDPHDFEQFLAHLRVVMTRCTVVGFENKVEWAGWVLWHGHQIDPWCHGPQSVLSEIGGAIGGVFERVIPGFDIQWLNPTNLAQPPRCDSNAFQMLIPEAADAYVRKHGVRMLHGHTHRRRINHDRSVVCAGTCTKGRGEFAAIWPDGLAIVHEMRPLPAKE